MPCRRWAQPAVFSRVQRAILCQKRNFPTLFRGDEIFQPFALATPLYSVNLRLSGGELLRLCSVVRWPTRPTDTLASSSCLLIPIPCTNGLVHGVARSAIPLRRLHSGALYSLEVFAWELFKLAHSLVRHEQC
jgi:hypothetical protein